MGMSKTRHEIVKVIEKKLNNAGQAEKGIAKQALKQKSLKFKLCKYHKMTDLFNIYVYWRKYCRFCRVWIGDRVNANNSHKRDRGKWHEKNTKSTRLDRKNGIGKIPDGVLQIHRRHPK